MAKVSGMPRTSRDAEIGMNSMEFASFARLDSTTSVT